MILYHGTRANSDSIRQQGLLAGGLDRGAIDPITQKYVVNKEKTLARVLAEFGLRKDQVPSWIYQGELEYEKDEPLHLHFELSFENVKGYADMGGESAYCIRKNLLIWLNGIENMKDPLVKNLDRQAKEANGLIPIIVKIEVNENDPRIDRRIKETWARVRQIIAEDKIKDTFEEFWESQSHEVRYYGDIPPDKILEIIILKGEEKWRE
jgi:hypothetical protein